MFLCSRIETIQASIMAQQRQMNNYHFLYDTRSKYQLISFISLLLMAGLNNSFDVSLAGFCVLYSYIIFPSIRYNIYFILLQNLINKPWWKKFTLLNRSNAPLFFKNGSLAEVPYLLIKFKKTKSFLGNTRKTSPFCETQTKLIKMV